MCTLSASGVLLWLFSQEYHFYMQYNLRRGLFCDFQELIGWPYISMDKSKGFMAYFGTASKLALFTN